MRCVSQVAIFDKVCYNLLMKQEFFNWVVYPDIDQPLQGFRPPTETPRTEREWLAMSPTELIRELVPDRLAYLGQLASEGISALSERTPKLSPNAVITLGGTALSSVSRGIEKVDKAAEVIGQLDQKRPLREEMALWLHAKRHPYGEAAKFVAGRAWVNDHAPWLPGVVRNSRDKVHNLLDSLDFTQPT